MALHVISAGAAQSVVQRAIDVWQREGRGEIAATYGAVGAQRKRLLDGAPADLVILTAAMIDELMASGHVVAGTRSDLGAVVGGIAVLWMRGLNLSLSSSVGFIALFGIAVLNGVVLVSHLNTLRSNGASPASRRCRWAPSSS